MIDHLTLTVRDLGRARAFYDAALAPLGYAVQMTFGESCGYGARGKPSFWLRQGDPPTNPMHIAFRANRRSDVDGFHAAALSVGGRDNGTPGLRPDYHPSYYGAFVFDLDGHPIEAVCHAPERAARRVTPIRATARRKAGTKRTKRTSRPPARKRRSA